MIKLPQLKATMNKTVDKTPPEIDLNNFFPYIVSTLSRDFQNVMDKTLSTMQLSVPEWRVLLMLSRNNACSLNELVSLTGVTQSTLSRVIDRMEKKELLIRIKKAGDNRFSDIRIREKGIEAVTPATDALQQACNQALANLEDEERDSMIETMKKLIGLIENPE